MQADRVHLNPSNASGRMDLLSPFRRRKGELFIVVSAVFFGMMPLLAKRAYAAGSNAYAVAFYRFFIGAILLFGLIRGVRRESIFIGTEATCKLFGLAIPYTCVPVLLYASYERISSGLATTLHFTYPLCVMLIATLVFRERPTVRKALCCALCLLGIALLYTPDGRVDPLGIGLALASGVLYAIYVVLLARSGLQDVPALKQGFWLAVFSAAEIGVIALVTGRFTCDIAPGGWAAQGLLALLTTVIALALFQRGTYLCGSVKASMLSAFEPLTGVVIGVAALHESISSEAAVGIAMILISTVLLVLPERQSR